MQRNRSEGNWMQLRQSCTHVCSPGGGSREGQVAFHSFSFYTGLQSSRFNRWEPASANGAQFLSGRGASSDPAPPPPCPDGANKCHPEIAVSRKHPYEGHDHSVDEKHGNRRTQAAIRNGLQVAIPQERNPTVIRHGRKRVPSLSLPTFATKSAAILQEKVGFSSKLKRSAAFLNI